MNLSSYQRIAMVEKVDGLQEVLEDKYPKWEIVTYDTPKELSSQRWKTEMPTVPWYPPSSCRRTGIILGMNLVWWTAVRLFHLFT
mgnify:CR=1 FL=1